jgi:tripartite-type tricarboxylate transporter receptor subunit TctC
MRDKEFALMLRRKVTRRTAIAAAGMMAFADQTSAQNIFPRTITIVCPTAAGGGSDIIARTVAPYLSTSLKQPVVIDNKVGAGGIIAATAVAHAQPDGCTWLLGSSATHGANSSLYKSMSYDPIRDFAPIGLMGSFLFGVVAHPSVPANSMEELVAYAKSNPGKLSYAGVSSTSIVMTETMLRGVGVDIVKIPYKSAALAIPDLIAGRISMAVMDLATASQLIQDGKLRLLGLTSPKRSRLYPQTPTIAESVVPGFAVESWIGMFAPAQTSQIQVETVNAALISALEKPDVQSQLARLSFDIRTDTLKAFRDFVPREIDKFTKLVRAAGIEAT